MCKMHYNSMADQIGLQIGVNMPLFQPFFKIGLKELDFSSVLAPGIILFVK